MEYTKYTGPYPIGIVSGITLLLQALMLALLIKNVIKTKWEWKKLAVIGIETAFILINGYFLLLWYIIVSAML